MTKPELKLYLAAPRGFCAGVDRAIKIVEMALQKWGAPVFVRHEIVHNKFVVDGLRAQGAIFVKELDECPDDRPVIFSAHGVPKSVPSAAQARNMIYVDATCPLVSKVHIEAERHSENGLQMIMIGHAGHPETIGTMGQLPDGEVLLVETEADVETVAVRDPEQLAYITQTTLSIDDTAGVVTALQRRFPNIVGPAQRRYLLRHHKSPRGCQSHCAALRCAFGGWGAQFFQFQAFGRSGLTRRMQLCAIGAARERHRLARVRWHQHHRHHRRRLRARCLDPRGDRRLLGSLLGYYRNGRDGKRERELQSAARPAGGGIAVP